MQASTTMSWENTFLQYQPIYRFKMPKTKFGTNWQNAFNAEQQLRIKVMTIGNSGCGKTQVSVALANATNVDDSHTSNSVC